MGFYLNGLYNIFDRMCNDGVNFLATTPPFLTPSQVLTYISRKFNLRQFAATSPPYSSTAKENSTDMQMLKNQRHHWWDFSTLDIWQGRPWPFWGYANHQDWSYRCPTWSGRWIRTIAAVISSFDIKTEKL